MPRHTHIAPPPAVFVDAAERYELEIINGMKQAIWVTSYADYIKDIGYDEADARDLPYARGGDDWVDVAPPAPPEAKAAAKTLVALFCEKNDIDSVAILFARAMLAEYADEDAADMMAENAEIFGHYMAMAALGHGVGWEDDHAGFLVEYPHFEAWYDGEALEWSPSGATRPNPGWQDEVRAYAEKMKARGVPEGSVGREACRAFSRGNISDRDVIAVVRQVYGGMNPGRRRRGRDWRSLALEGEDLFWAMRPAERNRWDTTMAGLLEAMRKAADGDLSFVADIVNEATWLRNAAAKSPVISRSAPVRSFYAWAVRVVDLAERAA